MATVTKIVGTDIYIPLDVRIRQGAVCRYDDHHRAGPAGTERRAARGPVHQERRRGRGQGPGCRTRPPRRGGRQQAPRPGPQGPDPRRLDDRAARAVPRRRRNLPGQPAQQGRHQGRRERVLTLDRPREHRPQVRQRGTERVLGRERPPHHRRVHPPARGQRARRVRAVPRGPRRRAHRGRGCRSHRRGRGHHRAGRFRRRRRGCDQREHRSYRKHHRRERQ